MVARLVVFGLVAGLVACGDPWLERDTQVLYAPTGERAVLALTGPITTTRFPTDIVSSTRPDASVFVMDLNADALTYRQFVGITATYDAEALTVSATLADACSVGQYAFALLDSIRTPADERIGRSRAFDDAFELRDGDTTFGPLRAGLVEIGVELGSVAGATLFNGAGCL